MATRLDRLFVLLDSGSTPATRKAAAQQLGEVQKLHPHELPNLLSKVHTYLKSSTWETRIAAGQAIEAIAKNVPQWNPPGVFKQEDGSESPRLFNTGRMVFSQFDIQKVIHNGAYLLGSEGTEYEVEEVPGLDPKERLAKQRLLLKKKLGLEMSEKVGLSTGDIFSDEDFIDRTGDSIFNIQHNRRMQRDVGQLIKTQMAIAAPTMSSREKNRAKRKAKLLAKQKSRDTSTEGSISGNDNEEEIPSKKAKSFDSTLQDDKISSDEISETITCLWEETGEWPFEDFCEELCAELFSPCWEVRHGAATGLREIIKLHGKGAGKTIETLVDQMELVNQVWLEDTAIRLLCVLALDKFGDFVSDEVVAPVRETCAQTLGTVLHLMTPQRVEGVIHILLQLLKQSEWETRHGGLLGLKYLLAVRQDMTSRLLPLVFPYIFKGLQDSVDDVSAIAAAALLPVAGPLARELPQKVPLVISLLWDSLIELDDLTASTNSIMTLLASLLASRTEISSESSQPLNELVPRLWPFLSHTSTSVRKAVLQTLYTVISEDNSRFPTYVWFTLILSDALRYLYQRSILEHVSEIQDLIYKVWCKVLAKNPAEHLMKAASPWPSTWLCLMMQHSRLAINPELLLESKHKFKERSGKSRHSTGDQTNRDCLEKLYIGGFDSLNASSSERDACVINARLMAAKSFGMLLSVVTRPGLVLPQGTETPLHCLGKLFLFHLNSKSALQRLIIGLVVMEWASTDKNCYCPEAVRSKLLECLQENIYYDEVVLSFSRMQTECKNFIASLKEYKLPIEKHFVLSDVYPIDQALALSSSIYQTLVGATNLKSNVFNTLEDRKNSLHNLVTQTQLEQQTLNIRVKSILAGALVALKCLPEKLNPIIRPLMDSIKLEENPQLQKKTASSLTQLLEQCISRDPCPNVKIIKNLCSFLCSDPHHTPQIKQAYQNEQKNEETSGSESRTSTPVLTIDSYSGILTLMNQFKLAEKAVCGRRSAASIRKTAPAMDVCVDDGRGIEDESQKQNGIQRLGAEFSLTTLAQYFGEELPTKMPKLWEAMFGFINTIINLNHSDFTMVYGNEIAASELIESLQIFEIIGPSIHPSLLPQLTNALPQLCHCLEYPYAAVRHMASRCLAMLSKLATIDTMNMVLEHILPLMAATDIRRQGAIEALANIIEALGIDVIPFIVLLVVPVLGRMSDQNEAVRLMATHCFATLTRLMPLESGIPDPPNLKATLVQQKAQERRFLEQLMDASKLENYEVPVSVNAKLRKYQQDGVDWLAFLNKYKLHGILCDDMGLGKTLQSICILAGDHYYRDREYKLTKHTDCVPLPSIVICPPTLTGHWVYEVQKFVKYLHPLHYTGPPSERTRLQSKVKKHNLVIASYDIVRNDIDFFSAIRWNYCILDEGHIIKNGKTKLARAVKQLQVNHRLILSGTPMQNNVLELWSLFDFLMPGFLGTERQFNVQYGKPILQSRDAKSSSKEQEAGALAMEALHRQVLPFLLRRMKEDVLQDLPPKIIQDYYCELSSLQIQLYEDFARSRAKRSVEEGLSSDKDDEAVKNSQPIVSHVFQALQYLRKVCNHPMLVLTPQHPQYDLIASQLKHQNTSLWDIQHAAKLIALKQLLLDCGIGIASLMGSNNQTDTEQVVSQHRALIFCQLKSMLDIIERDLFKVHLPSITYLRLDGSVPLNSRHSIVHRFNNDPSIDVLLLTTSVGGLGLNLTGADTVIFFEHDWNPMKDLQAMDRAHRIGQKKVVNVYRLITKGTLEEKIMGLQKFKLNIANSVISQENSSLYTMGTDQLLDLFNLNSSESSNQLHAESSKSTKASMKNILEGLGELWDEKQYESEYDLTLFMNSLK